MLREYRKKTETKETILVDKEYYNNLLIKVSLLIKPESHKDFKRLKMTSRIYDFIKKNPGCSKNDILFKELNLFNEKTKTGKTKYEGTIKRFLYDMVKSPIPYLKTEGKARATKYHVTVFSSPSGDDIKEEWKEFTENRNDTKEFVEKYEKLVNLLKENGNKSILLMSQKQYKSKPKTKKRSDSFKH